MKICFVASTYPRSETDTAVPWLRETVNRVSKSGEDVTVFAPSFRGLGNHSVDGVKVHRFRYFLKKQEDLTHDSGAPTKIRSPRYMMLSAFYVLCGTIELVRLHRKEKFDLFHVHWPFPHATFAFAAQKVGKRPIVLNFHGAELLLAKKIKFVDPYLRKAISRCAAVATNSSFTAGKVTALGAKEVHILPYGCPLPQREVHRISHTERRLLFVGRLIERKGVEYLVRAMETLKDRGPYHLTIVGSGTLLPDLKKQVQEAKLGDWITFKSDLSPEDLVKEYEAADVFVLPAIVDSRGDTEGLGVVLIEAISFDLPVVASNVGGIPDVIVNGETGVLVSEKDPMELAKAIHDLMDCPERAGELVHNAKAHVKEQFTWEGIVDKTLALYAKCAAH